MLKFVKRAYLVRTLRWRILGSILHSVTWHELLIELSHQKSLDSKLLAWKHERILGCPIPRTDFHITKKSFSRNFQNISRELPCQIFFFKQYKFFLFDRLSDTLLLYRFCAVALDDSSIAILGGEIPTQDGIAISPDMKTYNLDNDAWTENPGNSYDCGRIHLPHLRIHKYLTYRKLIHKFPCQGFFSFYAKIWQKMKKNPVMEIYR